MNALKIINIQQLKKDLASIPCEKSIKDLILGNAEMHNLYLEKYERGERVNPYIIWQLNTQVFKQLLDLKKLEKKLSVDKDNADDFLEKLKSKTKGKQAR